MRIYTVIRIEIEDGDVNDTCSVFKSLSEAKEYLQDFYYSDCRMYNFDDEIDKKVEDSYHLIDYEDTTFEIMCKMVTFEMEAE